MELKSRKDMNPEFMWDVSHIYADTATWEAAFDEWTATAHQRFPELFVT